MSPEQFFGDVHVDVRTDLHALVCVVYEMLTGAPPFTGKRWRRDSLTPPPRSILVGRERELADGRALLAGRSQRCGGRLLLGGEPGVGTTHVWPAHDSTTRVGVARSAWGHCNEMEGMPPYTPFVDVLEHVSRLVPPATCRATLICIRRRASRCWPSASLS
ncbi:MAG: hypothetical protein ACK5X2_08370 [Gemmatimonadaceae bacterium]|jgi:hypothetical protein